MSAASSNSSAVRTQYAHRGVNSVGLKQLQGNRFDESQRLVLASLLISSNSVLMARHLSKIPLPLPYAHSPPTHAGKVSKLRLLGDNAHATRIAFVEFAEAEGAMAALNCSGAVIGKTDGLEGTSCRPCHR